MTIKDLVGILSNYDAETEIIMDVTRVVDPTAFTLIYSVNAITGFGKQIEFVFLSESD